MKITVNGEPHEIRDGATVGELIEGLGLATAICAAEVNHAVIRRDARGEHTLFEGDTVEIVTLVGGG